MLYWASLLIYNRPMEENNNEVSNLRLPKYILIGLVLLQIVVLGLVFFFRKGSGSSGDGEVSSSSLVPFWLIILIPIIVSRRKKQTSTQTKNLIWLAVGLAVVVLLGMTVFLLRSIS